MVDNIESNIVNVASDVDSAGHELRTAHAYQRKAGRRMLCLMLILGFVAAIVLLAVSVLSFVLVKWPGRIQLNEKHTSCVQILS